MIEHDIKNEVDDLKNHDLVTCGRLWQTIWERAWMVRGMEDLMMGYSKPEIILDKITKGSI